MAWWVGKQTARQLRGRLLRSRPRGVPLNFGNREQQVTADLRWRSMFLPSERAIATISGLTSYEGMRSKQCGSQGREELPLAKTDQHISWDVRLDFGILGLA
jgi:hypothetical protein